MGSFVPVAFQALQAFQTVNNLAGIFDNSTEEAQSDLALRQLQQSQQQQQQLANRQAELDRREIFQKAEEVERQRRAALKRAMARQRAKFGGQGISAPNGSSEAVLLGLFSESEAEKQDRERLDRLKLKNIDENLYRQKRVNTLAYTQKAEQEKLRNMVDPYERINDIYRAF